MNHPISRHRCPAPWAILLAALGGLALAAAPARAGAPFQQGEKVRITGIVTDAKGTPLADVQVSLVAARSFFNLRQLKPSEKDSRRVTAQSGAKGEYSIDWVWDTYYNNFAIEVGLPVREGRQERIEVLAKQDMTAALAKGTVVVPALIVQNAALIDKVRQFLASLKSEDERRIYQEMGNPDEIKTLRYPDHEEVSWWYFEAGTVFRFRSGTLVETTHFPPVKPF